ncbi:MAG: short-chain type dehydrogenase/reductase [Myxococcaceae bacterium]
MHTVITGASSGIGEALVQELRRRGHRLTLVARRRALLEQLARGHEQDTHVVEADLSDVARATDWLGGAEAALGPVDVLINNAGVQIVGSTPTTRWEDGERLLRVDLHAPLKLTLTVLPGMLARRSGTIVDIASMAGLAPTPFMYFYNAAKAGLGAASESLRGELKGTGVHVLTVYPGPVRTAMESAARDALELTAAARYTPTGTTAGLARRIADGIERRRARIIYPRVYALSRHFPNLTRWLMDALTPRPRALTP